jgi:glycosyltransferase involved in cell wall biosynthesis
MSDPLFSIVIVNYNYGRYLDAAIRSVLDQSCGDKELIVVDGGSSDESVRVIERHADRIGWWCSEPDNGQSDAFNKGFSRARGRFLTWLNADDIMFPGALARARTTMAAYPGCEWFTAGSFWLDPLLRVIRCTRARAFSRLRASRGEIPVWAPSSFFGRSLYERVGGLDVDFHYMMDTELWLRFHRRGGAEYRPVPGYCWGLRLHPDAKMSGHNFADSEQARETHPRWAQVARERQTLMSRYGTRPMTPLVRALSTSPAAWSASAIDTLRFRGRHWNECV